METAKGDKLSEIIFFRYYDVSKIIYAFFTKNYIPETLDVNKFSNMLENRGVNINPSVLFDFLELNGIKLAIIPKFGSRFYQYNVIRDNKFFAGLDCESRKEAEHRAIMTSLDLLNDVMSTGKLIKYVK